LCDRVPMFYASSGTPTIPNTTSRTPNELH